ncbi:MAG: hypothetical protein J6N76_09310 [Lachnospiraceae bacterium]|nr:hypothetical protein [Lachnospiraceae bacterium]
MMSEEKNYKEIYDNYIAYEAQSHEKNQKKIKVGLKVNILLPLVFLIISFLTKGSKLVFLILWIVSLFGISAYLIYIEYRDYRMQERLKLFAGEKGGEDLEVGGLIGAPVAAVEEKVGEKMDEVDEKINKAQAQMTEKLREVINKKSPKIEKKEEDSAKQGKKEDEDA